jgi:hypothetical protein
VESFLNGLVFPLSWRLLFDCFAFGMDDSGKSGRPEQL